MTRSQARRRIAELFGAKVVHEYPDQICVQFNDNNKADDCKAVLDAFDPGFTGAVFGINRLLIASPQEAIHGQ